ncbi:MAG: SCO family protein [Acidobacteriota bacterium]|nr:SCO family protein [Acidobacteriota bacterium]
MRRRIANMAACFLAAGALASAQQFAKPALDRPEAIKNVGIDQKLNGQLPLELLFRDETGQTVRLGQYFRGKPVVLALVYYECPMLCNMVLNGLVHGMEQMTLDIGKDFEIVTVSFNPRDTWQLAGAKKGNYMEKFSKPGVPAAWHFLTGQEASVKALADAAGFRYYYDRRTKQFAHASAIMIATPDGKLSRYLYGIEYKPRDLRLALVEASKGQIGTPTDKLLLYCFHYDPMTGKYGLIITNVIRFLGSATALALGTLLFVLIRRDRRNRALDIQWRSA